MLSLALVVALGLSAVAQTPELTAGQLREGPLQKLAKPLGQLIGLELHGGVLQIARSAWGKQPSEALRAELHARRTQLEAEGMGEHEIHQELLHLEIRRELLLEMRAMQDEEEPSALLLFERLRDLSGANSITASSDLGETTWSFRGDAVHGTVVRSAERLGIRLDEVGDPGRSLEVEELAGGGLKLQITDFSGDLLLVLLQADDGAVSIVQLLGSDSATVRAPSYLTLYAEHRAFVHESLLPTLAHFGIGLPLPELELRRGGLQSVREPLGQLIVLEVEGSALRLAREAWEPELVQADLRAELSRVEQAHARAVLSGMRTTYLEEEIRTLEACIRRGGEAAAALARFEQLARHCGSWPQGSSHLARTSARFGGGSVAGTLEFEGHSVSLRLEEVFGRHRSLSLVEDGRGHLEITIDDEEGLSVTLEQKPSGHVSVQLSHLSHQGRPELLNHAPRSAASFRQLQAEHGAFLRGVLRPILCQFGIDLPPDDSARPGDCLDVTNTERRALRQLVLARVTHTLPSERARAERLIRELDDTDPVTRADAADEMREDHLRYRPYLLVVREQDDLSDTQRAHLDRALATHGAAVARLEERIAACDLDNDPHFLVELFPLADLSRRQALVSRLQALTGWEIGDDPRAWRGWLESRESR